MTLTLRVPGFEVPIVSKCNGFLNLMCSCSLCYEKWIFLLELVVLFFFFLMMTTVLCG